MQDSTLRLLHLQLFRPSSKVIISNSPARRHLLFRRAIDYAESLDKPIAIPEFSAAVDVSRRVLELAFQETLAITPLQYLHRRRLNFVHRDLLNAEPGSSSVTQVANLWGFSELGRFAVEYKRMFGESPSSTLNTTRHSVSSPLMTSPLERSHW